MTKEDVLKIFPNATAENIANILNCVDTEVAVAKKSRISDEDLTKLKEKAKKFEEMEAEKLTADEKLKKLLAEAEQSKTENLLLLNRTKAISELAAAGLAEEDYKDIIDGIVYPDEEKTINLAKSMAALISKKKSDYETELKDEKMKNMPKPDGGGVPPDGGEEKTEAERFAEGIAKAQATSLKAASESRKFYMGG